MQASNRKALTVIIPIEYNSMMGGMLQSVQLTIEHMPSHVKCIVVVPTQSEVSSAMLKAGAEIVQTNGTDEWIVAKSRPVAALRTFRMVRKTIRRLLKKHTVLWTNHILTEVLCGLGDPFPSHPRVFTSRGSLYNGFSKAMLARSLKNASLYIGPTTHQEDVLVRGMNLDPDKFRVIADSVNLDTFANIQNEPRPEWCSQGLIHIGIAGFPSRLKNQELLIRALAVLKTEFPQVRGIIAGSPGCEENRSYLSHLQRLVNQLGLNDFVQFVPFEYNKRRLYAGFDILFSTSLS